MDPESVALLVADTLRRLLAVQDSVSVAVSSGPLLLAVLSALATRALPWQRIRFLMADELAVPPSDPRSRYRALYDSFFSRIGVRPGNVLRYWSEGAPPEDVAAYYGQMTAEVLESPPGALPRLDVVLLEIDGEGTVGAFAPGSPALADGGAFARPVEKSGELHYTITGDPVRRAGRVFVLGTGRFEDSPVVAALRPTDGELLCVRVSETAPPGTASHS